MDLIYFGNNVKSWLTALLITALLLLLFNILKTLGLRKLSKLAPQTKTDFDDVFVVLLKHTQSYFLWAAALYIGSLSLVFPALLTAWIKILVLSALFIQGGFWGDGLINHWLFRESEKRLKEDAETATTFHALGIAGRILLWTVVGLLVLDNLPNVEINSLIASLGIGGIAVALAVQNILGDLFASLSIVLDKPFVIGDYVVVGDYQGTVEDIGLRSTRVRSLSGELLIFSNVDMLDSRIRNYKHMEQRRVSFSLGVTYQTSYEQLVRIPQLIQEIIESQPHTRFEQTHFKTYGDSSLNFETVYYLSTPDYEVYLDVQQAINLEIFRRFASEGIQFAYPTQTILVEQPARNSPFTKASSE
ncbi:MAG: mechanosensitive ion channel family protein [Anaerolineae bacterium]|nr:mechanosensitive ion channel family protein [Anaerolineae bacterium]